MFGGSGTSRGFVRTRISRVEKTLAWVLLGVIAGIALAIFLKGQRYDPALFALEQTVLPAPAAPGSGIASGILAGLAPAGWQELGPIEAFTADDLYEKINGRAEQYLAYDVVWLACASLVESPEGPFIDVLVYDMGRPAHAFGIFAAEAPRDRSALALGREGYQVEASCFFWKGRFYVQVIAVDRGAVALGVARTLAARLEDGGESVWGLEALPAIDRVPGSVEYFRRDALSLDFLMDTYTARYRKEGEEVTIFLSRRAEPGLAAETLARYTAYLEEYGSVVKRREVEGHALVVGEASGYFDVVFQKGRLLGGVSMAEDQTLAEEVAIGLLQDLEDRVP